MNTNTNHRKLTKAQKKNLYNLHPLNYLGLKEGDKIEYVYLGDGFDEGDEDDSGREPLIVVSNKKLKVKARVNPFTGKRAEFDYR
jgi:hypothetical protein